MQGTGFGNASAGPPRKIGLAWRADRSTKCNTN
jgi:hypothetical protein